MRARRGFDSIQFVALTIPIWLPELNPSNNNSSNISNNISNNNNSVIDQLSSELWSCLLFCRVLPQQGANGLSRVYVCMCVCAYDGNLICVFGQFKDKLAFKLFTCLARLGM